MIRRAAVLAALVLALVPAGAAAATELNVVPHGQHQPGVPWATVPGMLPANAQALMYDRLTPLGRAVSDAALIPSQDGSGYLKSARLLAADDPSLITDETVTAPSGGRTLTARIRRDAYGVPHVYSDTDDGVVFGAGYVTAQDRNLLLNQARYNGVAGLIDMPGTPVIGLVLGLYDYQPTRAVRARVTREQTRALRAAGSRGVQVLRDIDTYLVGINRWYAANQPSAARFTRADIYALNAVKAQFLGEGGGEEVANAEFLATARDALGRRRGTQAYEDLRSRDDPESVPTTRRRFPWQTNVPVTRARGLVALRRGSFRSAAPVLPGKGGARSARVPRREASNILMVAGERTRSGHPIFVGGPQIGFTYPGLTLEMGLYGPHVRVRGATSAPFPGYMLIGRGERYAWTLTSAGADIIDTYAETLCGGSRTRYRYKGRCRRMRTVDAGTIARGGETVRVRFRRTVHGSVIGYARAARSGRLVALAQRRSSAGRETTDQIFFQQMTFGRVRSARDFVRAAAATPQTFNSFYASDREIGFFTSGRLPLRPRGVNPDLPVSGTGRYEWRGHLPANRHPQVVDPASGVIVNWNNKPARDFPAGDERWGEGPVMRNDLLRAELARVARHTPATVLGAASAAATQDPRALMWPTVRAVLAEGRAPSPLAQAMVDVVDRWRGASASWVDADLDGTIDDPGIAVLQAVWPRLSGAALCGRLEARTCTALETRKPRFDAPPGGMYAGWHQYMDKDLRTLLGRPVRGRYGLRYCGRGSLERCARDLWDAIEAAGQAEAARQGGLDPATWRLPTVRIRFAPLALTDIQYTNRPTGIHQVMQFAP